MDRGISTGPDQLKEKGPAVPSAITANGWLGLPGQIQDCKVSNAIIALADKPVRVKSSVSANALFIAVVFCFFFLLPFPFLPGAQTSKNLPHAFQFRLHSPL